MPTKTLEDDSDIDLSGITGSGSSFSDPDTSNNTSNIPSNPEELEVQLTFTRIPGTKLPGSEDAKIAIIEFRDYQDPYSSQFNQATKYILISEYVDTWIAKFNFINLIINDLPEDKLSTLAAEASFCAAEQNKYWEYYDEIFRNSKGENTGWITLDSLTIYLCKQCEYPQYALV